MLRSTFYKIWIWKALTQIESIPEILKCRDDIKIEQKMRWCEWNLDNNASRNKLKVLIHKYVKLI